MFALMLFMFFFFVGSIAMFAYLIQRINDQAKVLRDEHAQLRVLLRAMESRLDRLGRLDKTDALFEGEMESAMPVGHEPDPDAARDPLLRLNFEMPSKIEENMGLKLDMVPQQKNWDLELTPKQGE